MFDPMRRKKQALDRETAERILDEATSGVLSLITPEGYPYGVPMSYVREGGKLYFHCASVGTKLRAMAHSDKACFTVICQDQVVPERYTTHYRSVMAFGRVKPVTDEAAKVDALMKLAAKYSPAHMAGAPAEIAGALKAVTLLEMTLEQVTGKQSRELAEGQA